MNDNELLARIENLENEVETLKVIIKMLKKDADFSALKKTPEESYDPNEFDIENGILYKYLGKSEEVTIPYGVKIISENAFAGNNIIKKVNFPDTVTEIEEYAFCGCENLVEVNNTENITKIRSNTFYRCIKLEKININNVIKIGNYAFYECESLKRIRCSDNLELIGSNAFKDCKILNVSIPDTCIIEVFALSNCKNVKIRK
ncbi:MAG: leucine-rich repeat domain-containing protein [Ruminococcus sp.]|nr:leucine-rich repeat domain-containing protein [Ruminococcus sp.]